MIKALVVAKPAAKFAGMAVQEMEVPISLGADEVFVRMKGSRVNPADLDLCSGTIPFIALKKPMQIGGIDGAGIVTKVGDSVKHVQVNDPVSVYCEFTNFGTWAEQVVLPAKYVAKTAKSLTLEQAAASCLTSITAYDSLFNKLKVKAGNKVLILGGTGGVGFAATQFAVAAGCQVYATGGGDRGTRKLIEAGVTQAIDYKAEKGSGKTMEEVLEGVGQLDGIFDASGKASLSTLMATFKPKKMVAVSHPNAMDMVSIGVQLSWFWRALLTLVAWWDNSTAAKHGVELIGQVTPAGNTDLMQSTAEHIDKISNFKADYQTISLSTVEADGMNEHTVGKTIMFL